MNIEIGAAIALSHSWLVPVISERMRAGDHPLPYCEVIGDSHPWCAVVRWPADRHHWILLPLICCPFPKREEPVIMPRCAGRWPSGIESA